MPLPILCRHIQYRLYRPESKRSHQLLVTTINHIGPYGAEHFWYAGGINNINIFGHGHTLLLWRDSIICISTSNQKRTYLVPWFKTLWRYPVSTISPDTSRPIMSGAPGGSRYLPDALLNPRHSRRQHTFIKTSFGCILGTDFVALELEHRVRRF